jgi:hypothetical protein
VAEFFVIEPFLPQAQVEHREGRITSDLYKIKAFKFQWVFYQFFVIEPTPPTISGSI